MDPLISKVTLCTLLEGWYEAAEYQGSQAIHSLTFPELALTAEEILQG